MALKIHLVNTLPTVLEPNSIYLVKGDTDADVDIHVVGQTGAAVRKTLSRTDILGIVNSGGMIWVDVNVTSVNGATGHTYRLINPASTTVLFPASPGDGDIIAVKVSNGRVDNTINPNGKTIEGAAGIMVIDKIPKSTIPLRFSTSSNSWEFV